MRLSTPIIQFFLRMIALDFLRATFSAKKNILKKILAHQICLIYHLIMSARRATTEDKMDSRESRVRAYHVDRDGHHDLGVYPSKSVARDELTDQGADLSTIVYRECRQYGIERTRASDGVTWYPAVVVALDDDDAIDVYLTRYDGDDEYAAVDDISATEI